MFDIRHKQHKQEYSKRYERKALPDNYCKYRHHRTYRKQYHYQQVYKSFVSKESYLIAMIIQKLLKITVFIIKALENVLFIRRQVFGHRNSPQVSDQKVRMVLL